MSPTCIRIPCIGDQKKLFSVIKTALQNENSQTSQIILLLIVPDYTRTQSELALLDCATLVCAYAAPLSILRCHIMTGARD